MYNNNNNKHSSSSSKHKQHKYPRVNRMINLWKKKNQQQQIKLEKRNNELLVQETQECTFKPKINKHYISKKNNKSTDNINRIQSAYLINSHLPFYERNIKWLHNIKDKHARLTQIKEINSYEHAYKPSIINDVNWDKIFNDKKMFDYWVRNNKIYLDRKSKINIKKQSKTIDVSPIKEDKGKGSSVKKCKEKKLNCVNNNRNSKVKKKNQTLNRSIEVLHNELLKDWAVEEDNDFNNYSL